MSVFDIVFLILAVIAGIRGFAKGILIEMFTLLGLILGIIGCMKLTHYVLLYTEDWFTGQGLAALVVYVAVFLLIFILVLFAGKSIEKLLKLTQLNLFNRISGCIFGIFKVAFVAGLIYWLMEQADLLAETTKELSYTYKTLKGFSPAVIDMLSSYLPYTSGIIEQIEAFFERIIHQWNENS